MTKKQERLQRALDLARIVLGPEGPQGRWNFQNVPISTIRTDTKRFQNRVDAFSKKTFNSIVSDAEEGKFDFGKLDAITLWRDPKDGQLYVLAGHSRFAAFKHLSESGRAGFDTIPAKILEGDERAAIEFARNSNSWADTEQPVERAQYFRELRESGLSKSEIAKRLKQLEGRNARLVEELSYLTPHGKTMGILLSNKNLEQGDNRRDVESIAQWVGKAMIEHPKLTSAQEDQLFDYLLYNGGKSRHNRKEVFLRYIKKPVQRWEENGANPLEPLRFGAAETYTSSVNPGVASLLNKLAAEHKAKQAELNAMINDTLQYYATNEEAQKNGSAADYVARCLKENDALVQEILAREKEIKKLEEELDQKPKFIQRTLFGIEEVSLKKYKMNKEMLAVVAEVVPVEYTPQLKAGDELILNYFDLAAQNSTVADAICVHYRNFWAFRVEKMKEFNKKQEENLARAQRG